MSNQIKQIIQKSAKTSSKSKRDVVNDLMMTADEETLFQFISQYILDPSIERKEFIICIYTLCQIDSKRAAKYLMKIFPNLSDEHRFRIVDYMNGCGAEYVLQDLIFFLKKDPVPEIRFTIALTLGIVGNPDALPALQWSAANDHAEDYEGEKVSTISKSAIKRIKENQDKS